jgi:hypothetical protein
MVADALLNKQQNKQFSTSALFREFKILANFSPIVSLTIMTFVL